MSAKHHTGSEVFSDREIVSTRVFEASRQRLFRAFSDPTQLVRWWGPKGFTSTFHEFDFRPGGEWRFIMHGPDGADFPNHTIFDQVVEPERIVFRHLSGPPFQLTMTFAELAGGTKVSWRMLFESGADCDRVKPFAVVANEQNFDRLAAIVEKVR
jgi:uncharacterized protein YndB with AHSA1/START domain